MRTIKYTKKFKQDFKREKKSGTFKKTLEHDFLEVINLLAEDKELPAYYCDHRLSGDRKDHRDCHIKPDFILIFTAKQTKMN